jgi:hypothetical protein
MLKRYLYAHVHFSIVHDSKDMELTEEVVKEK